MAAPTTTRATLRRMICRQLAMPFYRLYETSLTADAGSSTSQLVDADLTQPEHYWEGSWIYGPSTETIRQIVNFEASGNKALPNRAFAASFASNEYEILTGWNVYSIHNAINRAIEKAFPAFYDLAEEELLVLQEDRLEYSLAPGTAVANGSDGVLNYAPYKILNVAIERPSKSKTGNVASAAATTVTLETGVDLTDVTSSWYASVYDGTGRGQFRKVISVTGQQVTISSGATNWTTTPDTTSKIHLWDPTDEVYRWNPIWAVKFDRKAYPTLMHFSQRYPGAYGCRIRLRYIYKPAALTTEDSTTVVPAEFIVPYAVSMLAGERAGLNKYDRDRYTKMRVDFMTEAEQFKANNYWNIPQGTAWQERDPVGRVGYFPEPGDPLGWRSH